MKLKCAFLLIFTCLSINAFTQNFGGRKQDSIYKFVEIQPEFPGGYGAMHRFLLDSITLEVNKILDLSEETKVHIQFVVEKDGSCTNFKCTFNCGSVIAKNVLNGMYKMPKWQPGKSSGIPVRTLMTIPYRVRLG